MAEELAVLQHAKDADVSAAVYSIVETAKTYGLRPFSYLKFLLERLPFGASLSALG